MTGAALVVDASVRAGAVAVNSATGRKKGFSTAAECFTIRVNDLA
jgi:hypothetical protein